MSYQKFIASKSRIVEDAGKEARELAPHLFEFQKRIVVWALRKGRAAILSDCGTGKSAMQLEWLRQIDEQSLILAPLAVAHQTCREAAKFGMNVAYAKTPADRTTKIAITNYENLDHWLPYTDKAIVLDESSILKAYGGKTRTKIIEAFADTPYRLACTATAAPNDYTELGNHCQFLGVMKREEMLASYFTHDMVETQKWRLKGHAEKLFWRWITEWAVMIRKPSDLGFSDEGFVLPPLNMHEHVIASDHSIAKERGMLFDLEARTLAERRDARRASISARVAKCAEIVAAKPNEQFLIWCNLNAEGDAVTDAIPGAVQIAGADEQDAKAARMNAFTDGTTRVLVTKPSIAGFGMNWQQCANMIFVGLSDSYEDFYQAARRTWRFGQKRAVDCHVVIAEAEGAVLKNIQRKEADATRLAEEMVKNMSETVTKTKRQSVKYATDMQVGEGWNMRLGDCVDQIRELGDASIDYSIFSPPFASLYTYSASDRDMGNCATHGEFYEHFKFLVPELLRVTKPGRLLSFHCMLLPTSKTRDGVIGLTDFRGILIRAFQDAGWIFHSEVVIWKDPVTAMQRTKALGLLYKQLRKDSAMSRQGIPDYLVTMRAPGVNAEPVTKTHESFPVQLWQNYASPVWMDIDPSRTLQSMRENDDERHICPLQLDVIERAIRLWTNPGDVVLSPFGGIGSEGYVALTEKRRFVGIELKRAYYERACKNLALALVERERQGNLFAEAQQ